MRSVSNEFSVCFGSLTQLPKDEPVTWTWTNHNRVRTLNECIQESKRAGQCRCGPKNAGIRDDPAETLKYWLGKAEWFVPCGDLRQQSSGLAMFDRLGAMSKDEDVYVGEKHEAG